VLRCYDPSCHDYSLEGPEWREVREGHFVLANSAEAAAYGRRAP
jgi:oligopeptide transport system ATP-binding protein